VIQFRQGVEISPLAALSAMALLCFALPVHSDWNRAICGPQRRLLTVPYRSGFRVRDQHWSGRDGFIFYVEETSYQ